MRAHNLVSAKKAPAVVSEKLAKEKELGRIMGPFREPPFSPFHVSPIGLVEKKEPNTFRLIHHLSFPKGGSVNDFIPKERSTVHYATIQDAIHAILSCKPACFIAKTDLKAAFRQVPMAASQYPLLGFIWNGQYWYDRCLPMGASSSCALFERVSSAIAWIAQQFMPDVRICKVLDDFAFISSSFQSTKSALEKFIWICGVLGFPIAEEKTMGPATTLPFLGITLDTVRQEARLPEDKLDKCRKEIGNLLQKRSVRLRQLQSVLGVLNFACSVIVPGRAFLRRLHNLTIGIKEPYHFIRLTAEAKEDLLLWLRFLSQYNGRSFFLSSKVATSNALRLHTDSSGTIGYGAIFHRAWFNGTWPEHWKTFSISILELYPIVAALVVWGERLANQRIELITDNIALVSVINNQTSKNNQIMFLLRKLILQCLKLNISFSCSWLAGRSNIVADALSRFQMTSFRRFAKWADPEPVQLPEDILPENMSDMPHSC